MKVRSIIYLLMLVSLGLGSCSSGRVTANKNDNVNFRAYKTYSWKSPDIHVNKPEYNSDLVNQEIRSSVNEEMKKRGFVEVDSNSNPDLLLTYHTYTELRQEPTGNYYWGPGGYYPGFYPYNAFSGGFYYPYGGYGGTGYSFNTVYNYTDGTLVLDMIDTRTNQIVWQGSIDGDVEDTANLGKKIDRGVHAILKKFPVKEPS